MVTLHGKQAEMTMAHMPNIFEIATELARRHERRRLKEIELAEIRAQEWNYILQAEAEDDVRAERYRDEQYRMDNPERPR